MEDLKYWKASFCILFFNLTIFQCVQYLYIIIIPMQIYVIAKDYNPAKKMMGFTSNAVCAFS